MKKKEEKKEEVKEEKSSKEKGIELAIAAIKKQYGAEAILTNNSSLSNIDWISSGSITLDRALGKGYAKGRIIEIYGPAGAGKTSLVLHAIAECQKAGGKCAFVDAEYALDNSYAAAIGVNMNDLLISQPSCGEEGLSIVDKLIRSHSIDLIVVDSVAALVPQKELEGNIGDQSVGLQARLLSQTMRMISSAAGKANTCVIFVNQIRMKIIAYGNPEVTTCGNALKFYASQRIEIRQKDKIEGEGDQKGKIIAIESKVKVVKNKVARPFEETIIQIEFGKGINWAHDLVLAAEKEKIIDKSGSWYSYKGNKLGQGMQEACRTIASCPDFVKEIKEKLLSGEPNVLQVNTEE